MSIFEILADRDAECTDLASALADRDVNAAHEVVPFLLFRINRLKEQCQMALSGGTVRFAIATECVVMAYEVEREARMATTLGLLADVLPCLTAARSCQVLQIGPRFYPCVGSAILDTVVELCEGPDFRSINFLMDALLDNMAGPYAHVSPISTPHLLRDYLFNLFCNDPIPLPFPGVDPRWNSDWRAMVEPVDLHSVIASVRVEQIVESVAELLDGWNPTYLRAQLQLEFCKAMADQLKIQQYPFTAEDEEGKRVVVPERRRREEIEMLAISCLLQNPEWNQWEIFRHIGCNSRSIIYRCKKFKEAWEKHQRSRLDLPRGFKQADGSLEAYE